MKDNESPSSISSIFDKIAEQTSSERRIRGKAVLVTMVIASTAVGAYLGGAQEAIPKVTEKLTQALNPSEGDERAAPPPAEEDLGQPAPAPAEPVPAPVPVPPVAPAEPVPAPVPVEPAPVPTPAECVANLPLNIRIGQLIMPGIDGNSIPQVIPVFQKHSVGGAIIMNPPANLGDGSIQALKTSQPVPLMLAVDEEGGSVQRLHALGRLPSARRMAATKHTSEARAIIANHGRAVKSLGIDVVFGPVADVGPKGKSGPMKDRVFSTNPTVTAKFTRAYVDGWRDAGILPVVKHAPGHGSASGDTHNGSAVTPHIDALRKRDLKPYVNLAASGAGVMTGHLIVPGFSKIPASFSYRVIHNLLRKEYGFAENLIFSDSLSMDAITKKKAGRTRDRAVEAALRAGNDVAIYVASENIAKMDSEIKSIVIGVTNAVAAKRLNTGSLNKSVLRVLNQKQVDPCSIPVPQS